MPTPDIASLAKQIAEALQEPNTHLLRRVVEVIGPEAAATHLAEAQQIEAAGGELITSGKRRRTAGGVFFRLVRLAATAEQRKVLGWPTGEGEPPRGDRPRVKPVSTALPWAALTDHLQPLLDQEGIIHMSKITLTGRPGRIITAQDAIITIMASDPGKAPTLPRGLPQPPTKPTSYVVYIAAKQWAKVAEAIKDPGDVLIIEGYPVFDERLPGLAVLTQSITTRNLQRAKRESERG